ncbi:LysR family transcriptional regulator [Companilactobacillus jidongensis]|uniref:LysR family transcriptional regulator n=1 Tax=Companilactobacillus jidongensis TaxID=2486006 RepID=UPI000F7698EA|nr:LysR family transcriptional regulator [Companilactobacillus jidongensis]
MLKLLETFKTVYETKSFSKASKILFISQPTVSGQIMQLENDLNIKLFIRNGRQKIVATPQADILYKRAIDLIDDWEDLKQEIRHDADKKISCELGASHTFAIYLLPILLPKLYKKFPNIHFTIRMMNSMEVLESIETDNLDFGFIEKPLAASNIKRTSLCDDQLVLVDNGNPWLVREPASGVYYYTKQYLAENNITEPKMEVKNNEMIVRLLNQNFGTSIISKRAAEGLNYKTLNYKYERKFYLMRSESHHFDDIDECINYTIKICRSLF